MYKKKLTVLAMLALTIGVLTACGGSGSGTVSTGGVYFTHSELASEFVNRAYADAGIDISLVKSNTLQYNYIVVYDRDYGTYDAYDLTGYNVGDNILDFVTANSDYIYYDLIQNTDGTYEDYYTGTLFEETSATSKDLEKMAALKQELTIQKSAKKIEASYGLSADRSREVARLAVQLKQTPKASMTDADYDAFSKEILGSSITDLKSAVNKKLQGDSSAMDSLVEQAAEVNGVGPEHMNKIINDLFAQN
jgi:hypothetical protein